MHFHLILGSCKHHDVVVRIAIVTGLDQLKVEDVGIEVRLLDPIKDGIQRVLTPTL